MAKLDRPTMLRVFSTLAMLCALLPLLPSSALATPPPLPEAQPLEVGTLQDPPPPPDRPRPPVDRLEVEPALGIPSEQALDKLAPPLRDLALSGGKEVVRVVVEVTAGTDLRGYLSDLLVRPFIFRGNQTVYGTIEAGMLLDLASLPEVTAVDLGALAPDQAQPDNPFVRDFEVDEAALQARLAELRGADVPFAEAPPIAVSAEGWFDVLDGHRSSMAWDKGFTGEGVVVGVVDDGVDYGHPDLMDTLAHVTDPASPYYGWPMAFNSAAMYWYAVDTILGQTNVYDGGSGIWYADTTEVRSVNVLSATDVITYAPLIGFATWGPEHEYLVPVTSQSGVVHVGSFPDRDLQFVYGERVAVLVTDEHAPGVYDTVYVDLDNDYDFSDEKPAYRGDEIIYRDMDGDGYTDISGGALQWIADGVNPLPAADWVWGLGVAGNGVQDFGEPGAGDLVMFTGAYDAGWSHGTACASNIVGQGVVAGGLTAQPFRVGGMVQGAAPGARLMDFGDRYWTAASLPEIYLVAALGYDGLPYSGDEVQITTNSYGAGNEYFGNWDYLDRYLTDLNHSVGANTAFVFSYGNSGPGYHTTEGRDGVTTIKVSSSSQFGSTNWDSIAGIDQLVYGDVTAFATNGPDFDGNLAPDVLANGGRGAGSAKINSGPLAGLTPFDGWTSWETWGGTSRSGPVAGGNLALIYEAYRARYGVWPTYDQAETLLMAGATDANADPSLQGAGVVNADRSTDLAAGIYGVYATPSKWNVGGYRGTDYESFAHMVSPGDVVQQTFTLHNPSGYEISVDLSDGTMSQIGAPVEIPWTSVHLSEESGFNFHSPDYLIPIDPGLIPADTELMVVRIVQPMTHYDPDSDYTSENHWRHIVYRWTDLNGDGVLWEDRNGNGVVNHVDDLAAGPDNDGFFRLDFSDPRTEMQEGEYLRLDYNFSGNTDQLTIRDPLERMGDGIFVGFQHRRSTMDLPVSGLTIYLEFYERVDWPWLALSDSSLTVPAWSSESFVATMSVPVDAPYGFYDGHILVADPGDAHHDAHTSLLPVGVNVVAELGGNPIVFGGGDPTDRLYDNNVMRGLGQWVPSDWPSNYGDWRHFFVDVPADALGANDYLLTHVEWDDAPPTPAAPLATDIDAYILGPAPDGFSAADPATFGPYTLDVIGTSQLGGGETGIWRYSTWTGGADDWAIAPMDREGLYELGLHNGLFAGNDLEVPFQATVGKLSVGADLGDTPGVVTFGSIDATVYTDSGTIDLWFTPTLELPGLNANLSGGLVTDMSPTTTITVVQSDPPNTFSPWIDDVVTDTFTLADVGTTYLRVYLDCPTGSDDPDLFLIYDTNGDGHFTPADGVFASDGRASGGNCSEQIEILDPPLGDYAIFVDGFTIGAGVPGVSTMDSHWQYWWTHPGPLPTEALEVYSGTIAVGQDNPVDPTTASYSMTLTTDERIAGIYVTLTDQVSPTVDIDLYVSDGTGAIIAQSQNWGTANETIELLPPPGAYRFQEGEEYTIWVHGYDVPAPPADAHLNVTWDVHNLWLSASHADVHVGAIGAGEGVSLTLNFDKAGWLPGDADLSGRLTLGPDGFESAIDEVVTVIRDDPPGPPGWNPGNLFIDVLADSARGPSWIPYWAGVDTALIAGGERVTYTAQVANWDAVDSDVLNVDVWPLPSDYLVEWFTTVYTGNQVDGVAYGLIDGPPGTAVYTDGIGWNGVISAGESVDITYWVEMTATMSHPQNHTSGVDVFSDDWMEWYGWYMGGALYLSSGFYGVMGSKDSSASVVEPGEIFDYSISLVNPSSEDASVYFSDPLPDDVSFISATGGATYNPGTHTVSWAGLVPGTSLSTVDFDIVVQADADLEDGTVIHNVASLADKVGDTPYTYFDAYTAVDDGIAPDLVVEKTVSAVNGIVGEVLEYTITFHNDGTETAEDAVVFDSIPSTIDVVPGSVSATKAGIGTLYDPYYEWIRWWGDLAPGETVVVTFQATINDSVWPELALINPAIGTADNFTGEVYSSALTEIWAGRDYHIFLPLVVRE